MAPEPMNTIRIVDHHDRTMQMLDAAGVEHSGRTLPERVGELIELAGSRARTVMKNVIARKTAEQEHDRLRAAIVAYRTAVRNCNGIAYAEQALFAALGEE